MLAGCGVSGVEARLIAGFENAFATAATVREVPSVEPAVDIRFLGLVLCRQDRCSLRCEASSFGGGIRRGGGERRE